MTPGPDVLDKLPHRAPFRFVTRVLECSPGAAAVGVWSVAGSEGFFAGHFPGNPIVPGVLIGEALAQLAGLVGDRATEAARLAQIDLKLHGPVTPPADITLHARLTRALEPLYLYEVSATVRGTPVASGRLTLVSVKEGPQ